MLRYRWILCVVFAALLTALVCVAQAPPAADTFVSNARPSQNFGASALLPVQPGTTSYIRLNLSALPSGVAISKAALKLYVNAVVMPGSFDVVPVEGPWTESGLTFQHAPQLGASATGGQ